MFETYSQLVNGGFLGAIFYIISWIFAIAGIMFIVLTYVLASIAMHSMAKQRELEHAWMAWVPILRKYLLGSIADDVGLNMGKRMYLGVILPVGAFFVAIIAITIIILVSIGTIGGSASNSTGTALIVFNYLFLIFGLGQGIIVLIAYHTIYGAYFNTAGYLTLMTIFQPLASSFVLHTMSEQSKYLPLNTWSEASANTGIITGINGMYAGQHFTIENGEVLTIGRDGEVAHIIIDCGADSVSRKHCSISFDALNHTYQIIDYSSNGTYGEGGIRIAPNIPVNLSSGSVISLGDRDNQFRLG